MLIRSLTPGRNIQIDSPAKLNFVLEVLGKRADGFHDISSIIGPITLWDQLELTLTDRPVVELELSVPPAGSSDDQAWQIPNDEGNLVVKAAQLVRDVLGVSTGCQIRLQKNIPAAAGLGGGSGNAAAVLVGCLVLWASWDRDLAGQLVQQLGSDVPFFLGTQEGFGMCLVGGRGETTDLIHHRPVLAFWLTHPTTGCSTRAVYERVVHYGSHGKIPEFMAACETGQESKIGAALFNALQLPASELNPWIGVQLRLLRENGCPYQLMTGSGSSCFGLVPADGHVSVLRRQAKGVGIPRVYQTAAWYGNSIEEQLAERSISQVR